MTQRLMQSNVSESGGLAAAPYRPAGMAEIATSLCALAADTASMPMASVRSCNVACLFAAPARASLPRPWATRRSFKIKRKVILERSYCPSLTN